MIVTSEVEKILPLVRLISQSTALGNLPANPPGEILRRDGYTVSAEKIRSLKVHLAGKNMALVKMDASEVVRVKYGGLDRQKTTKTGTQFSVEVDPPTQSGRLAALIKLSSSAFLLRGDFDIQSGLPAFRFFARIGEEEDWQRLSGMATQYEKISPYARQTERSEPASLVTPPTRMATWVAKTKSLFKNVSTHPAVLVFSTATWLHSIIFWSKTAWFPVMSVLALSIVAYHGWVACGILFELLPPTELLKETGYNLGAVALCLVSGWASYSFLMFCLKRYYRSVTSMTKDKTPLAPPTESSPSTSEEAKRTRNLPLESLRPLSPEFERTFVDVPLSSTDVSIRADSPVYPGCQADQVLLVGEFTIPLQDSICPCNDTGEYLVSDGDFILGKAERREGEERYVTLCQAHGADYLLWFEQVNCRWEGCLKKGVLWEEEGVPQRWCLKHLQHQLIQGGGVTPPAGEEILPEYRTEPPVDAYEPSITPPFSEQGTVSDMGWLQTFEQYRQENEQWRAAFSEDIQRIITGSVDKLAAKVNQQKEQKAKQRESGSETERSRTSVDHQTGCPPSPLNKVASNDGRSSGSASWGELENAWNLGDENGEDDHVLEKLWEKHCQERRAETKTKERRGSCPELGVSFSNPEVTARKRSNLLMCKMF